MKGERGIVPLYLVVVGETKCNHMDNPPPVFHRLPRLPLLFYRIQVTQGGKEPRGMSTYIKGVTTGVLSRPCPYKRCALQGDWVCRGVA